MIMITNKNLKKQGATQLVRLFDKGYLKDVSTTHKVMEKKGKKFTRVEMTFIIDVEGVDVPKD